MKKFLTLLFILICFNAHSQMRVVFFLDVPPLHRVSIFHKLDSAIKVNFKDTVTQIGIAPMPESYCKLTGMYNGFAFTDSINTDSIKTIAITYRNISWKCSPDQILGVTNNNTSIVSLYSLGTFTRTVKVCLHEIGHLYGLDHCKTPGCLMEEGGQFNVLDIIDKETDFCLKCKKKLWNN